jgi:hypothetical protein
VKWIARPRKNGMESTALFLDSSSKSVQFWFSLLLKKIIFKKSKIVKNKTREIPKE